MESLCENPDREKRFGFFIVFANGGKLNTGSFEVISFLRDRISLDAGRQDNRLPLLEQLQELI